MTNVLRCWRWQRAAETSGLRFKQLQTRGIIPTSGRGDRHTGPLSQRIDRRRDYRWRIHHRQRNERTFCPAECRASASNPPASGACRTARTAKLTNMRPCRKALAPYLSEVDALPFSSQSLPPPPDFSNKTIGRCGECELGSHQPPTPTLPGAGPWSERFRWGGGESNFMAGMRKIPAPMFSRRARKTAPDADALPFLLRSAGLITHSNHSA
jgi:hypothetical protein